MTQVKFLMIFILSCLVINAYAEMDHSGHKGMSGGGGDSAGSSCIHPHLDKIKPEKFAMVAPGSEFSFVVFNIEDPEQVSVDVKKQPVEIKTEFKDPFYIVRGKIPSSLHNTAARIDVKISSKYPSCRLQDGWLIKIAEN